jgi:hypothetical protein
MDKLETIYIPLLGEGTSVCRPTSGIQISDHVYRVLPTPDYESADEDWQFLPDSLVRCVKEVRGQEEILVAREAVL